MTIPASAFEHPEWMRRAACRDIPRPDIFYPSIGESASPALTICNGCPVVDECLQFALIIEHHGTTHGIWGATTVEQRSEILRGRRGPNRSRCGDCLHWVHNLADHAAMHTGHGAKCGTDYGYDLHGKHGMPACTACREAHAAVNRRSRQKRKGAA